MAITDLTELKNEIQKQIRICGQCGLDTDNQSIYAWFVSSYKTNKLMRKMLKELLPF